MPTALPTEQQAVEPSLGRGPFRPATITVPTWGAAADATCAKGRMPGKDGQYLRDAGEDWNGCAVRPDSTLTALVCTVAGPQAQSRTTVPFTFVAADKPVPVDDPIGLGNHHMQVSQVPPFDGQVTINDSETVIATTVP
ncbi:hypothetical protein [Micromonospora sp. NPDC049891]|uniref:hypothetical protein n=1 Tax=Micromonospora sp. NPDC049891 TaxID=3155655 RepID=UPI0033D2EC32